MGKILALESLSFSYDKKIKVINDLSLDFEEGKIYSILGKSGAGKSTLLSLLAGLTKPDSGKIIYEGKDIADVNKYDYRANTVGVIFQSFNLIPSYTAIENVLLSMNVSNKKIEKKKERALELLRNTGINEMLAKRRVLKLSGGEQQRIAITRAMSYNPKVILADEPTGNLDNSTASDIMRIFKKFAREEKKCIIIVTHDHIIAKETDHTIDIGVE
ncbi:MAG: ABC transporter ATP-binding protein [Clostridiales Family XIII bacterium]|jgi:putative ABC transport system ATP-binding protein|nr:ABC transporter ATP-binding protein [Clostridiales Family XIII bacterium]